MSIECAPVSENDWREVVIDLLLQYGYTGVRNGRRSISTGGMSACESAFRALGWDDPHDIHDITSGCDEPGCPEFATCGTPTPAGYRSTCSKHMPLKPAPAQETERGR